jgi:hypothetical protein
MFGYTMNTTYMNLTILNFFFLLTLVTENLQITFYYYLLFISGFGNILPLEKEKKEGC